MGGITVKTVILMVTWFYYGQPPATSQTVFSTIDACLHARSLVLLDAERLKNDAQKEVEERRAQGVLYNPLVPTVSAVCAGQ